MQISYQAIFLFYTFLFISVQRLIMVTKIKGLCFYKRIMQKQLIYKQYKIKTLKTYYNNIFEIL